MDENINYSKESWYKNTIAGKIANKFKEIVSQKGEKIFLLKDGNTDQYLNEFEYNGREFSTRTVYENSEVGDYDIGEGVQCVSLGDVAICPEFLQAIKEVEKEEGINFYIVESISLNDCLSIIGKESINFKELAVNSGLRDNELINIILLKIEKDLSEYLEPDFKIKLNYGKNTLFVHALGDKKQEVINKSPLFMDKLQKISEYFNKHMNEIKQSFKDLAEQEQKKNNEIKKEQEERLNNLKKQL